MRALLVDDERLALRQLQAMLETAACGVEVVGTCTDSQRVVELATELKPDVVFLDITMPEVSGLEVGARLASSIPEIKIVFVTAHIDYTAEAYAMKALDYIMKPVFPNRLRKTIELLQKSLLNTGEGCRESAC